MRKFLNFLLGIVTALLAAPLLGWAVAVFASRHGVTRTEFALPFGLWVKLGQTSDLPSTALWLGLGIAVISAVFLAWLFNWLMQQLYSGRRIATGSLAIALACYAWLAWDGPLPEPIPAVRLDPHPGVTCLSREIALAATDDAQFGQAKDWPESLIAIDEANFTTAWAIAHESEIKANWEKLQPVKDWADQVIHAEGFDDHVDSIENPVLKFKPLRQLTLASRQMALLLTAQGESDQAASLIEQQIIFADKLQDGSRCLVTLMIAVALEKQVLKTMQIIAAEANLAPPKKQSLHQILDRPAKEWSNLARCFLNESSSHEKVLLQLPDQVNKADPWQLRAIYPLKFNRNTSIRQVRISYEFASGLAARNDSNGLKQWRQLHVEKPLPVLAWKNWFGKHFIKLLFSSLTPKLFNSVEELQSLRKELTGKLNPAAQP